MGAWPEREAPAERIASVVLAVEKGMDSSIPFSVALYFFRAVTHDEVAVPDELSHPISGFDESIFRHDHLRMTL